MWLKVKKLLLDLLRRIHVETDKDPIYDMLRRILLKQIRILFMIC